MIQKMDMSFFLFFDICLHVVAFVRFFQFIHGLDRLIHGLNCVFILFSDN